MKVAVEGEVIWTTVPICCQPMPKSPHDSVWGLVAPMRRSWSMDHWAALLKSGEAVRRGPMSSKRPLAYSMMWELLKPSSRMRASMSRSMVSVAGWGAGLGFSAMASEALSERASRTAVVLMVPGFYGRVRWRMKANRGQGTTPPMGCPSDLSSAMGRWAEGRP
jgi:hypothetical protein